jgi:hypothetical protein
MALEAPLRSSTDAILASYSPLADMSVSSPDSASIQSQYIAQYVFYLNSPCQARWSPSPLMPNNVRSSTGSDNQSLRPNSFIRPNPAQLMSPSDIVGPSPVTSNGTEIEDEATEETVHQASLDIAPQAQVRYP